MRASNLYGNLTPWSSLDSEVFTVLSFLDVTKYPPSLLFLLVTLGPAILFLGFAQNWKGDIHNALVTIGRVPIFFYILHLYVIHLLAMIAAAATGFPPKLMIIDFFITETEELQWYGFDLWVVYLIWIMLVLALYPVCKWYWNYKKNNREKWWLGYM